MSRGARRFAALAAALSLTKAAQPSLAETAPIEFFASGRDCPEPGFVNRRFFDLVGEGVATGGRAVVTVTKAHGGEYEFSIRIEAGDGAGERRFLASSCRLGTETAALIIAISLFPERANDFERRSQDLSATPQSAEPPPDRMDSSSDRSVEASPPTRPPLPPSATKVAMHGALSLAGALDTTSMPGPGVGFGVSGAFGIDRLSVEVTGAVLEAQTLELPEGRAARFTLVTLGAHVCYSLGRAPLTVSPCLGATGLRLTGEGFGAQRNFRRVGLYGGPALGSAIRWIPVDWLAVRIYAEFFVSLARPSFVLENAFVHQPARIGLSAFAGPELRF